MERRPPLSDTGFGRRGRGMVTTSAQRQKIDRESCRGCGYDGHLDAAHTIPRPLCKSPRDPDAVIPLCRACHGLAHAGKLDLLPLMTVQEQVFAVRNVGSIAYAYEILSSEKA